MKKNIFLLTIILTLTLVLSSCKNNVEEKSVEFNKSEFYKQKDKWLNSGIECYSFTYAFDGYKPEYILGTVNIDKSNSIVDVYYTNNGNNNSDLDKDSKYYIENIEDIFTTLFNEYQRAFQLIEIGDYDYIKIECKYNEFFGYPEYISNYMIKYSKTSNNKDGTLVGNRNSDFKFKIKEFKY